MSDILKQADIVVTNPPFSLFREYVAQLVEYDKKFIIIGNQNAITYKEVFSLIQTNKVKKAYATDVAKGPLSKAHENIAKLNLNDKIETILCDGLEDVSNDVDEIIIAGMGGNLITNIIANRKYNYKTMILQPNLQADYLRRNLSNLGYKIIDEKISFEKKKYYEIIKISLGDETLNEKQIKYGPINLINRTPLFISKWQSIANMYRNILIDFKGSAEEFNRINNEINDIEDMLKETTNL